MAEYKKKFSNKEIKQIKEVIDFLKSHMKIAEKEMDSVSKNMFESNMIKLTKLIYK